MIKLYTFFFCILLVGFDLNAQIMGPEPDTVCVGDTAMFSIQVMAFDSVKWEYAPTSTGPWDTPSISDVDRLDTLIMHVYNSEPYDNHYFRAVVWEGGVADTSENAFLMINSLPMPMIDPVIAEFCQGGNITLYVNPGFVTYNWSNGVTDSTNVVFNGGQFSVTVTDENNCSGIANREVYEHDLPIAIIDPPALLRRFCENDSLKLMVLPAEFSYKWNTGDTTQFSYVNQTGTYTVTVTNENGCGIVVSATVEKDSKPNSFFTTFPPNSAPISEGRTIQFIDGAEPIDWPIEYWHWDFGEDADIPETTYVFTPNNLTNVTYLKEGTKIACLEVKNIKDCIDTSCDTLTIIQSPGPIVILDPELPNCIGDTFLVTVRVINSLVASYELVDTIHWEFDEGILQRIESSIDFVDNAILEAHSTFRFLEPEDAIITVTGYQRHLNPPHNILDGSDTDEVPSGNINPEINLNSVPEFLCEGVTEEISIHVFPPEDGDIRYSLNNGDEMPALIDEGEIKLILFADPQQTNILLKIHSIKLDNGCGNSMIDEERLIQIRQNPPVSVVGDTLFCLNETAILEARGADFYDWVLNGDTISVDSMVSVNTELAGNLDYYVYGKTSECTTSIIWKVEVAEPPEPAILGDTFACNGQVKLYSSNDGSLKNFWTTQIGEILGNIHDSTVLVRLESSGNIKLIQTIGNCRDSVTLDIGIVNEESAPYNDLVYLSEGGIILYPNPNPNPITKLCYQWYKDGTVLPGDTYQGLAVGMDQPESELKRYSVEVTYCEQSADCAQIISYRESQEQPSSWSFDIKVFPNPSNGLFQLEYEVPEETIFNISIFDSSGRLLNEGDYDIVDNFGRIEFNLSGKPSSVYIIKVIDLQSGHTRVVPVSIIR